MAVSTIMKRQQRKVCESKTPNKQKRKSNSRVSFWGVVSLLILEAYCPANYQSIKVLVSCPPQAPPAQAPSPKVRATLHLCLQFVLPKVSQLICVKTGFEHRSPWPHWSLIGLYIYHINTQCVAGLEKRRQIPPQSHIWSSKIQKTFKN